MKSHAHSETATVVRRPYTSLPRHERDWLKARHHIDVTGGHTEVPDHWGALRAWNDDEIAAQSGFPSHPHTNMEIITYVREGVITHQDSLGNTGETRAGDVQIMSAGTGIRHAEYNLQDTPALLFQIWIAPDRRGGPPAWGTKPFPKSDRADAWVTLASGYEHDTHALPIRARARVLGATLRRGAALEYALRQDRMSYLVTARGRLVVNGEILEARDGAAIRDTSTIALQALEDVEVVLVDVSP